MADISQTAAWAKLSSLEEMLRGRSMRSIFDADPERFERYSLSAAGLFADFSKNKITDDVLNALLALASEAGFERARTAMFAGERINTSEDRAVLHVALRDFGPRRYPAMHDDPAALAGAERAKMKSFADAVYAGFHRGYTGKPLTTVVNIGIGGSDLGPAMVTEALRPYWISGRRTFFVSNVDGQHLADALSELDPETTLFIIASKTFTTDETITNATSARDWLLAQGAAPDDVAKHFVALSTNAAAVSAFGIDIANMFQFWDWVGGRFSLWSAIGLPIALQVGFDNFERLLRGAYAMDEHFRIAPPEKNMPALLALIGVWNRNFMGAPAHAVLPYDQHLLRLAAYLQQGEMESNGKRTGADGALLSHATCPVIFGEPGTNGQHAFYQLIHQGTDIISADFIAAAKSASPLGDHHEKLLANFLAQPEALMSGKTEPEVRAELEAAGFEKAQIDRLAPQKVFPGERPTTSILMERLTPETVGALIALYEHKIFVQGVVWGVNSFDQWGVELGKELAKAIRPKLGAIGAVMPAARGHDASTNGLIDWINAVRAKQ